MKNLAFKQAYFGLAVMLFLACSSPKKTESTEKGTGIDFGSKTFNYYPPLPENGKHKGVIVIGGAGMDAFIIEMDKQRNWKLRESDFAQSKIYENEMNQDLLDNTIATYVENMRGYNISDDDIHFVLSSTASQKTAAAEMVKKTVEQFGFEVKNITADKEAAFSFQAVMPTEYADNSFVMDIGSGNTKISWKEGNEIKTMETYGSKYYLTGISDSAVFDEVKEMSLSIPDINTKNCFLIGGAPYELAKLNEDYTDRYTVLNKLDTYKPTDQKTASGLNILKAISSSHRTRTLIFDWESNFAIGYLLSLPY